MRPKELPPFQFHDLIPLFEKIEQIHIEYLQNNYRYNRYRLQETESEWFELLGEDVQQLTHPRFTEKLVGAFVDNNALHGFQIEKSDVLKLKTAARSHDFGEIKIQNFGIGDITYDYKTMNDEEMERQVFDRVLQDLPIGPEKDFIREIYKEVVLDRESRLGKMFNAIERIGYWQTGLRAYLGDEKTGQKIANWAGLTGNMLSNQPATLIMYANEYPAIHQLLEATRHNIRTAFESIVPWESAPADRDGKPSYDRTKLLAMHEEWKNSSFA